MAETLFVYNAKEAAQTGFTVSFKTGGQVTIPIRPALSLNKATGEVFEFTNVVKEKSDMREGDILVARGEYATQSRDSKGNVITELHFAPLVHRTPMYTEKVETLPTGQKDKNGVDIMRQTRYPYDDSITSHAYDFFGVPLHDKLKVPLNHGDLDQKIENARKAFREKLAQRLTKQRVV